MFKIYDGRDNFFQWDLNRKLIVNDKTIEQVHYCNRTSDCSLVTDVYELDGLHVVDVPNILLQTSWPIRVFGYNDQHTKYVDDFKVYPRSKPEDYVYTEEEVRVWDDLSERIDEIEKNGISEEVISDAVYSYLEENPVDMTGYATEEYVDKAIEAIDIPEPDLSGYALKTDIPVVPTDVSAFKNDAGYLTAIPDEYVTDTELNNKGYLTQHQSLANYYTKAEVDAKIPKDVDLSNYATKKYVDDAVADLGEKQTYVVNITGGNETSLIPDMTYEVARGLLNDGKVIVIDFDNNYYFLSGYEDDYIAFSMPYWGTTTTANKRVEYMIVWRSTGMIKNNYNFYTLPTPSASDTGKVAAVTADGTTYEFVDIPDVSGYQTEAQVNALIDAAMAEIVDGEAVSY